MSKMNYFGCSRKLAERLTSFINDKKVDCGSIQYYYDFQIKQIRTMIESQDNLRGSIFSDEEINEQIAKYQAQIDTLSAKKQAELDVIHKFEWDDNDKALDKLSRKSNVTELEIACAITAWFKYYEYEVTDMEYVYNLVHTCFGVKEKSDKNFVRDILKGKDADATQRRTDSLKAFYAQIATDAIIAGTVKVKDLSEVVQETYAKEVADKKAKKQAKKSEKKNK